MKTRYGTIAIGPHSTVQGEIKWVTTDGYACLEIEGSRRYGYLQNTHESETNET